MAPPGEQQEVVQPGELEGGSGWAWSLELE